MKDGILLSIGVIFIILSRFTYISYGINIETKKIENKPIILTSFFFDIIGTILVLYSIIDYYNLLYFI